MRNLEREEGVANLTPPHPEKARQDLTHLSSPDSIGRRSDTTLGLAKI